MRVTCNHCGGAHPAFECRKKSTAARKDVREQLEPMAMVAGSKPAPSLLQEQVKVASKTTAAKAGTQALPVDTNLNGDSQVGRQAAKSREIDGSIPSPQTKFDRKAWMREYQRSYMRNVYRPKLKASKALSSQPQKEKSE